LDILAELQLKANLTDTQPVSAASLPLPAGAGTEVTLQAILDELELKADKTEIQPVSVCSSALPDGAAEEATQSQILAEVQLLRTTIKIVDEADPNEVYIGEALSGTTTSDPCWSIRRIEVVGTTTTILRASGGAFTEIWDDRTLLSYS
jgi:hypothetical protein